MCGCGWVGWLLGPWTAVHLSWCFDPSGQCAASLFHDVGAVCATDLSTLGLESDKLEKPVTHTHRRRSSQGRIELPVLRPLPKSLNNDMKLVRISALWKQRMKGFCGFCRVVKLISL